MNKLITEETREVLKMLFNNISVLKDKEVDIVKNIKMPKLVCELFNKGETFLLNYDHKNDEYYLYCDDETRITKLSKQEVDSDSIEASLYREFGNEEYPNLDFDGIVAKYSKDDRSWKMALNILALYDFLTIIYEDKSNKYAIKLSTNADVSCLFIDVSCKQDEFVNSICLDLNEEESEMLGNAILNDFGLNNLEETVD